MRELDPRKETILKAVIVEYVTVAEPVGSELLAQKYPLGVRSATIRNELAEMADIGFLEQPYTSAGRIPSDRGYRYYVDYLITHKDPAQETKQQVRLATEDGEALRELLRESTRLLSKLTQLLSAATLAADTNVKVRNAVLSALGTDRALLVLVLSNGYVENRLVECPTHLTLEDLDQANRILSEAVQTKGMRTLTKLKNVSLTERLPLEKLLNTVFAALRSIARELTRKNLITEGEEFLFAQPEMRRSMEHSSGFLRVLQDDDVLLQALSFSPEQEISVSIGHENSAESLYPFSVVRHRFYVGEEEAGTLALIGPTRMNYDQSIPLLSFTAQAISQMLTKLMK